WVAFSITVAVLLGTLASVNVTKSKGEIPAILGFQLFMVESGSMEPTLPVGTVILSRQPRDKHNLKAKDIVTFRSSAGSVVTHRIIEVLTDDKGSVSYRTKGDNPISSPDLELLSPENIIAVFIMKIPLT
ncbi:MAG: signal peptidase I, partial [Bacillota bacterium]